MLSWLQRILAAGLALLPSMAGAQAWADSAELHSAVQVTLVPPMGSNGKAFAAYTNALSINLLVGISRCEERVAIGGLANVTLRNAQGLQLAGLCNYAGGEAHGIRAAGLVNIVRGPSSGVALAGLINANGLDDGTQLAGLANVTRGTVRGTQLAGVMNVARDVDGSQCAGIINVARTVRGVQLAALVNVADSCDYPIGLLNLVGNGDYSVAATYDETGCALLTLRTGRKTYGILGVGFNPRIRGGALAGMAGIGLRTQVLSWLGMRHELTSGNMIPSRPGDIGFKTSYTLMLAAHWRHLTLLAGPSINHMHMGGKPSMLGSAGWGLYQRQTRRHWWRVHLGYTVGVQYTL